MSLRMSMPMNQLRHSNVAVVRYQKNGKRLELACYKNKVTSYRSGAEKRIDEVLQIDRIFSNVSRGAYASREDISTVLGDMNEADAIKFLLEHGDLQIAQHERTVESDDMLKDICLLISQKCVHPTTLRPYPISIIEQTLKAMGVGVRVDQPTKKQGLQLIQKLVEEQLIPIKRADMRLRISGKDHGVLTEVVTSVNGVVEEEQVATLAGGNGNNDGLSVLLEPSRFREFDEAAKKVGASVQVIDNAVMETSEGNAAVLEALAKEPADLPKPASPTSQGAPSAMPASKAANAKEGKKGKKGGSGGNDEDTSKVDDLASQLKSLQGGDSDSDGGGKGKKGKKGGKGGKKAAKAGKKASTPQQASPQAEPDSDEEVAGNRKNRKKQNTKPTAAEAHDDDLDDMDYGDFYDE